MTCFLGEVVLLFGLGGAVSGFSCYRPFLLFKLERFLVEFEQIFPLIWFLLAALVHPISGANLFFKLLVLCVLAYGSDLDLKYLLNSIVLSVF